MKMRRSAGKWLGVGLIALSGAALIATANAQDVDIDALHAAAQEEGTVVWYVTYPLDEAQPLATAFQERYPGVAVEIVRGSGTRIIERFETESRAGRAGADVITGALVDPHIAWKEAGMLEEWSPPEGAAIPEDYKDEGFWYLEGLAMSCMIYTTDGRVSDEEVPSEPTDLTDKRWTNRVGTIPAWQTATASEFAYYVENTLGARDTFATELAAIRPQLSSSQAPLVEQVIRGEIDIAFPIADYNLYRFKREGAKIDCAYPSTGVPGNTRPVSIPANAPHPNAAKLFMNWRLSEEGQRLMQDGFGMRSVREGMPTPEGLKPLDEMKVLLFDPAEVRDVREEMFDRWRKIFGT